MALSGSNAVHCREAVYMGTAQRSTRETTVLDCPHREGLCGWEEFHPLMLWDWQTRRIKHQEQPTHFEPNSLFYHLLVSQSELQSLSLLKGKLFVFVVFFLFLITEINRKPQVERIPFNLFKVQVRVRGHLTLDHILLLVKWSWNNQKHKLGADRKTPVEKRSQVFLWCAHFLVYTMLCSNDTRMDQVKTKVKDLLNK